MRKLYTIIAAVLLTAGLIAQAPQKMSYQCVVRNNSGVLVVSHNVGIRTTILQGSPAGTVVYQETYSPVPQTNSNGLVNLEIGGGTPVTGTFSAINWESGPYYLKTETDPAGGTSYTITGTSQLLSVPYALHARSADNGSVWTENGSNIFFNTGKVGIGTNVPPYSLSISTLSSNADISIGTSSTGVLGSDGLRVGVSNTGDSWLWNNENGQLYFGTNNLRRMTILGNGNIGIGNASPDASLAVSGTVKIGSGGKAFSEIIEVTGTTDGASTHYCSIAYPAGYTRVNTRVLSVEINANGDVWIGLGFTNNISGAQPVTYNLSTSAIYVMYPDSPIAQSKPFRLLLMKVE